MAATPGSTLVLVMTTGCPNAVRAASELGLTDIHVGKGVGVHPTRNGN